jgi:hypothetical protein
MSKVFIGGSKSINKLPPATIEKLNGFYNNGDDIVIGDAFGVDKAVQEYFTGLNYKNVTIYASYGKARNNVGNWHIVAIQSDYESGYDFYKQKDIAMANDCDYGYMIWDGKSRGTKNNIIRLVGNSKVCDVYLQSNEGEYVVTNNNQLDELLTMGNIKFDSETEHSVSIKTMESIMLIANKFVVEIFQLGSMFILPNGKLLYMQNGHQSFFDEIKNAVSDCKVPAYTLTKLGWIRLNTQVKYINMKGITATTKQKELIEQAVAFIGGDVQIIK